MAEGSGVSDHTFTAIAGILLAIIGVATIAVLVAPSAQTGNVVKAGGNGFACMLSTALQPIMPTVASTVSGLGGFFGGGCTPSVTSTLNFPTG
jgi:hypothetical protein